MHYEQCKIWLDLDTPTVDDVVRRRDAEAEQDQTDLVDLLNEWLETRRLCVLCGTEAAWRDHWGLYCHTHKPTRP